MFDDNNIVPFHQGRGGDGGDVGVAVTGRGVAVGVGVGFGVEVGGRVGINTDSDVGVALIGRVSVAIPSILVARVGVVVK